LFYHLDDHIYLTFFRKEAIILDLKKDQYSIFSEDRTRQLKSLLAGQINDLLPQLQNNGILKNQTFDTPYPFSIDEKAHSTGVFTAGWKLPLPTEIPIIPLAQYRTVFEAWRVLFKVHWLLRLRGFYGLIKYLKKQRKNQINYTIPPVKDLQHLVNCLNKAALFYTKSTKCLEWATALSFLCLKRQWVCNLVIGAQNYPFIAHAWAEVDQQIVADSKDFPENLSIILTEPFRKEIKHDICWHSVA